MNYALYHNLMIIQDFCYDYQKICNIILKLQILLMRFFPIQSLNKKEE